MIHLRAPEPSDVDSIFLWENDPGMFEVLPNDAPLSRFQIWEYVQNYKANPFEARELRLMIHSTELDRAVGYLDIFQLDTVNRRAGVAIYIYEDNRRCGYARAAFDALEKYAEHTLALHSLWAVVAVDNEASRSLFDSCGFKPSGRLRSWIRRRGRYVDALVFQKLFP